MKVSLITVAYNSAETIRDTIESVLTQTYPEIEYIIVDGKSSDNTVDIIKEYELRFDGKMKWISEPDKGLYDAMNKGISLSTGDVVGIINSDDLFCDNLALEKVINAFNADAHTDAVYADLFYVAQHDTERIIRKWITGVQKPFNAGWHPAHPTLYIKRKIYLMYGGFDLSFKLAADFEIMLRFIDRYKIKITYLQDSFVKMRLGGETNKSIKNIFNQNLECIRAFTKNGIDVNKLFYPIKRLIPKLIQFTI